MPPIIRPDQKPKHNAQENNSLKKPYRVKRSRKKARILPYLRINVRPIHDKEKNIKSGIYINLVVTSQI